MTADETEHEPITVEMADGSVYTLDGERRLRAFHQKYGEADLESLLDAFRAAVARHFEERTKPWKGLTLGWGEGPYDYPDETFEDHAALAEEVMYASIRAPLMAMAMREMAEAAVGDPEDAPSVISLREDGVVEYTGEAVIVHDSFDGLAALDGEDTEE